MQNRVGKFTRSMERNFRKVGRTIDKVTKGIKSGFAKAAAGLTAFVLASANVLSAGVDFEQTLVSAVAKFPGEIQRGTEAFKALEDAARSTGATTEFSASQAAEGLNFLAQAGFTAEGAIAALPGVVDLATAASIELGEATDIASDSLGAFGLASKDPIQQAKNLARINDVLAKTTTSANTNMVDLFETIKKGAPVATGAGASLETFAAFAGVMANSGLKASESGSTLKNIFLRLSAPTSKAAGLLKQLGVRTADSNGNLRDAIDILADFEKGLKGMGTTQRDAALNTIFGARAITGVNLLLQEGTGELRKYRKTLEGANGASTKMASTMRNTVRGSLNSLGSAVEGVKISIFSLSQGPLKDVVDKLTNWVRANETLIAGRIGEFLAKIFTNAELIATSFINIAKGVAGIFALSFAFKAVAVSIALINTLMLLNPISLIILAAVAAVALLVIALTPVGDFLADMAENIGTAFSAVGALTGLFGDDETGTNADGAQGRVVTPQERVARQIEETRTTSTAEVTIRDESGRAEVTGGKLGAGLQLTSTGAF